MARFRVAGIKARYSMFMDREEIEELIAKEMNRQRPDGYPEVAGDRIVFRNRERMVLSKITAEVDIEEENDVLES
jgi:hypothetical protein